MPNPATTKSFNADDVPYFIEPMEMMADGVVRKGVIVAPTGAGKTTVMNVMVPFAKVNDPGSMLIVQQTDPDAKNYLDTELMKVLQACPETARMLEELDRSKIKGCEINFPDMTLNLVGANMSSLQRVSVRYLLCDEAWEWKHGMLREAEARMHNRWNRLMLIISQGGEEVTAVGRRKEENEFYAAWMSTDRRKRHWRCLQCNAEFLSSKDNLDWVTQDTDAGELDVKAIEQSTAYVCPHCKERYGDTPLNRLTLSKSGFYLPTSTNAETGYYGWTFNVLNIPRIPWASFAIEWARARRAKDRGDVTPLKKAIQKKLAEFWEYRPEAVSVLFQKGDYSKSDFENGQLIDNEIARFMTVDRQRDHFWVLIRAWRADGSSRLLYEGRVLTIETCREIQLKYKVHDQLTFQDAQHQIGDVYNDCARYGWRALHGDGKHKSFAHHPKQGKPYKAFYSPFARAAAPVGGNIEYMYWAANGVKDELVNFRAGGRRPSFEHPKDVSNHWLKHMVSEVKTGEFYDNHSRPNHLWDCEAMGIAVAMHYRILRGVVEGDDVDTVPPVDDGNSESAS